MADVDDGGVPKPKKQKTGGFKWKEKKAAEEEQKESQSSGLHRGYRDRSPRKDSYRERERSPRGGEDKYTGRDVNDRRDDYRTRDRSPRRSNYRDRDGEPRRNDYHDRDRGSRQADYRARDRYAPQDDRRRDRYVPEDQEFRRERYTSRDEEPPTRPPQSNDRSAGMSSALSDSTADKFGLSTSNPEKKDKPKKPRVAVPTEPMIIVNINDRLGTKAAIPCLASDSVKAFKAIVAAHIGRQPHEIMLKRQGERPFKDQLTLEDYGVSSGVQLDLEIDTGD